MFRRTQPNGVSKEGATTTHRGPGAGYGTRNPFRFGTWLRLHGFDIFTMLLAGVAGLGIYFAPPAYDRWFAIQFQDGEIVYPATAVPLQKDLVPIWLAAFLAFMLPFVFFLLYQIRIRNLDHLFTTTMGLLKSLITAALFQVVIKCLVGGPRPHFLVVCNPKIPEGTVGSGFQQLYFTREVCTGDKKDINDALESLPSGHATAAFAGFIFLSLYFNAQLKLLSSHNPAYWKMLLFMGPILGAMLIALVMVMDGYHHWWDVTVGGLIGTACAFVAFRTTFASVWDFRFNHELLPRTGSLFHRKGLGAAGGPLMFNYAPGMSGQLPATREAGWGGEMNESMNGAPFDASSAGGIGNMMGGAGAGGMGAHHGMNGTGNGLGHHHAGMNVNGTHATNGPAYDATRNV